MPDAKPSGGTSGLDSEEELLPSWDRFRAGGVAECPADGLPLALSVDGSAGLYRFVCTRCGTSSPWFETSATGLLLHGRSTPELGTDA